MKGKVCIISNSFDLNVGVEKLICNINEMGNLVEKMASEFTSFSKSSDFDSHVAHKVYTDYDSESGFIMSQLYDQKMSSVNTLNINSNDIISNTNANIPTTSTATYSIFSDNLLTALTINPALTIHDEHSLVKFSKNILTTYSYSDTEYVSFCADTFKNIIFHNDSNKLKQMDGDYKKFLGRITECLDVLNFHNINEGNVTTDISELNAQLPFVLCAEGGGKNKRTTKELKRTINYKGKLYTDVNCEFHYKLEKIDGVNGAGTYYYNRIYFGFVKNLDIKIILISHIGCHL